jgi:hypothetical protein
VSPQSFQFPQTLWCQELHQLQLHLLPCTVTTHQYKNTESPKHSHPRVV